MNKRRFLLAFFAFAIISLALPITSYAETTGGAENPAFNLQDYQGKVVYLDFWASWCGPCRASFPFMNDLLAEYGDDLAVVTINLDEDRDNADEFIADFKPNFPVFFDSKGSVASQYGVSGMPNSFLFDRNGELILKHMGFTKKDPEFLRAKISAAISR
tara:strand:- start:5570 stop:6046 length:477 start_codon:yes stop_codon:yes gene_type:complete